MILALVGPMAMVLLQVFVPRYWKTPGWGDLARLDSGMDGSGHHWIGAVTQGSRLSSSRTTSAPTAGQPTRTCAPLRPSIRSEFVLSTGICLWTWLATRLAAAIPCPCLPLAEAASAQVIKGVSGT